MKRKRSVSLDLLLDRPIGHATEVSKTKIKTVETYLRNRFKCIEVLLQELRFPKELANMILALDDLSSLQWRRIFQITQQPSWRASRSNTARAIYEWCQWYLGRRVNFREVVTLFFSMFQDWRKKDWRAREQDKKVVFCGSSMLFIRKETYLEICIRDLRSCRLRIESKDFAEYFYLTRVGIGLGIDNGSGSLVFLPRDAEQTFFSDLMNTVEALKEHSAL
jgi:hypothetical protein